MLESSRAAGFAGVARIGGATRARGGRYVNRVRFIGAVVRSGLHYPATARPVVFRVVVNQIRFTAVQALPFLTAIALVIGVAVIVQATAQAVRFGFSDVLGRILAAVVVRELGPLLTAVVVIGRSGTAIAAELATDGVLGETEGLEALGIDPLQYLVIPRVVAAAISVALLTVFFDVVTLGGGSLFASLLGSVSFVDYAASLRLALTIGDIWMTLFKGTVFGTGIAMLCTYEGLAGGRRPTDIPKCVTRGVVASLLFVFLISMTFSLALYT